MQPSQSKTPWAPCEHFPVGARIDRRKAERGASQTRVPDSGDEALDRQGDRSALGVILAGGAGAVSRNRACPAACSGAETLKISY
jgi:hypothetical protein